MKRKIAALSLVAVLLLLLFPAALAAEGLNKDAPIVMWLPGNGAVSGFEEGATENDNRFINAIREKTGYKNLQVVIMPATDAESAMNLMLSSGDYPDVIYVNGLRSFFLRYLTEGLWAPVDEAVAAHGPEITKLVTEEAWATVQGEDGKHFGIPNPLHTSYNGHLLGDGIIYRKDIFDKMGREVPKTVEEFYELLKAVKEAYPDMIPYSYVGNTGPALAGPYVRNAFGLWAPYKVTDGKLTSTNRLYMKDFLTYMSKLYAEGLLDPEFLYQTGTNLNEKFINDKVFSYNGSVWGKIIRQTWASSGFEGQQAFFPAFEGIDGNTGGPMPFPVANCYMFPKTTKYMNEVVDLINTFLTDKELETFVNFGTEGEHYAINAQGALEPLYPAYENIIYKIYYRLWFKPDVWWNNAVLGDFVPEIKLYDEAYPQGPTLVNIFQYAPTNQASLDYSTAVNDIMYEYIAKIIVGELPVDAVDEMFQKMDESGLKEIEAADAAWYESTGASLAERFGN